MTRASLTPRLGWPTRYSSWASTAWRRKRSSTPTLSAKKGADQRLQVRVESSLGALYMFASDPEDAEGLLTKSVALARQVGDSHLIATALNNLANLHAYQKKSDQALAEYDEAVTAAKDSGDKVLALKISSNLVSCAVAAGESDEAHQAGLRNHRRGPESTRHPRESHGPAQRGVKPASISSIKANRPTTTCASRPTRLISRPPRPRAKSRTTALSPTRWPTKANFTRWKANPTTRSC